jgi:hypothetical protein
MFALGETAILPGLFIILVLFPAALWTLASSLKGKRNFFIFICAVASIVFGVWAWRER